MLHYISVKNILFCIVLILSEFMKCLNSLKAQALKTMSIDELKGYIKSFTKLYYWQYKPTYTETSSKRTKRTH